MKHNLALALLLILGLTSCSSEKVPTVTESNQAVDEVLSENKPNVVLILIDDLNHYGVTAYGANKLHSYDGEFTNKQFSTPNIDDLAKKGLMVNRAFAYPICENTRIALMSGKNNDRNYLQPKSQHGSDLTFGDAFKKAGYTSGLYGKWKQTRGTKEVHGRNYISEFGWDDYAAFDVVTEGQRFINPNLVINGQEVNYNGRTDLDPQTGRRWYGPDIVNRHALQFIETNKDKPFFLYYPMILVHDDHKPTPDTKPNSILDNFSEKAEYHNKGGDDRQYFPDMIEYMDKMIGKVVAKLEETGVKDNTLIIFTSDNGGLMYSVPGTLESGHQPSGIYRGSKNLAFEGGHRVPFIVSWPEKIKQSTTNDTEILVQDILATISAAGGKNLDAKQAPDSKNILPLLLADTNETYKPRSFMMQQGGSFNEVIFRENGWKLIMKSNRDASELIPTSLFNLADDVTEPASKNLIENKAFQIQIQQMLARYKTIRASGEPTI